MDFYKKWWFWLIIILALMIFFFPKSCGGSGGTGGPIKVIDCGCVGVKGTSLFVLLGGRIMDASPISCYGFCLKSTCKSTVFDPDRNSQLNTNCEVLECSSGMKGFFDVEHYQCECGYKCTVSSDCPSLACEQAPCPTKSSCNQGICNYSIT